MSPFGLELGERRPRLRQVNFEHKGLIVLGSSSQDGVVACGDHHRTRELRPTHLSYLEGHRQRLRDRFNGSALGAFEDHEVLELLLTYAVPRLPTPTREDETTTRQRELF